MKYIIPIEKENNETVSEYYNKCSIMLISFRQILRNHINVGKLDARKQLLLSQPNIIWKVNDLNFNILLIINQYINSLQCFYDKRENKCYYSVPNIVRCIYTNTSLNTVIRTLEYGGGDMPPLYWIRPSYTEFIKTTVNT
jgi:hypothetical protein